MGLISALRFGDLAKLEKLAGEAEKHWDEGRRVFYFEVMLEIWRGLLGKQLGNAERRDALFLRCAESMLDKGQATPLVVYHNVLPVIMPEGYGVEMDRATWSEHRKRSAELVLRTWRRLIASPDPEFDPDDEPDYPPDAPGGPTGGAPEAFKDPVVRRQYERSLAEGAKEFAEYSRQLVLRHLLRRFSGRAERYLIKAYSREPHNSGELQRCLDQHGLDEGTKARILREVVRTTREDRREKEIF